MDKLNLDVPSFKTIKDVQSYAGVISSLARLVDADFKASKGPTNKQTALHVAYSKFNNWSLSGFEHKAKKVSHLSGIKDARHQVINNMVALAETVAALGEGYDQTLVTYCTALADKWVKALDEFKPPSLNVREEDDDLPPSIPITITGPPSDGLAASSSSLMEEVDIGDVSSHSLANLGFTVVSHSKAKGKNKATALPKPRMEFEEIPKHDRHVGMEVIDHPTNEQVGSVSAEQPVFEPSTTRILTWIFEPGFSSPFVHGQKIKVEDIKNFGLNQVTWKKTKEETFYRVRDLSIHEARAAFDNGYIGPILYAQAIEKAPKIPKPFRNYTRNEALESGAAEFELRNAELEYQKAQVIKKLKACKLEAKSSFVETWYDRLKDITAMIDSTVPGNVFKVLVNKALKESSPGAAINKCFYSFKLSQLAVWKKGSSKEDVITYSRKAINCFWHELENDYIEIWKASPLASIEMRTGYGKLSSLGRSYFLQSKARAKIIASTALSVSTEALTMARDKIVEENELLAELTEGLSVYQKAKVRFSKSFDLLRKFPMKAFNYIEKGHFKEKSERKVTGLFAKVSDKVRSLWYKEQPAELLFTDDMDESEKLALSGTCDRVPTTLNKVVGFIPRKVAGGITAMLRWIGDQVNWTTNH